MSSFENSLFRVMVHILLEFLFLHSGFSIFFFESFVNPEYKSKVRCKAGKVIVFPLCELHLYFIDYFLTDTEFSALYIHTLE